MVLMLRRVYSSLWDTIGILYVNGKAECLTLEDEKREVKVWGETRIPAGTYSVTLYHSPTHTPRYGHKMLSLQNVPGFSGILIHKGNTEKDTAGCILVGNKFVLNPDGPSRIEESGLAYDRIYPMIAQACEKEIVDIYILDRDE